MATLAVLTVVFFVAGAHKNAQIDQLRHHGIDVVVTVQPCRGLLGGSGTNAAGYACRGSFTVGGHRYTEDLPGTTLYPPGSTLRAVTVPGDPALVVPLPVLAGEHTSMTVFILPTVLLVALLLMVVALLRRRRRRQLRSAVGQEAQGAQEGGV
jgi:hypothetical protein